MTESAKHRTVEHGLRRWNGCIRIAHDAPSNESTFDHHLGFNAKERRLPQHQIGQFARLDRSHLCRNAMRDSWIDRVFRDVTLRAEVVVAFRVLWQSASLYLHLMRGLPCPQHHFADPSHGLAVAR